MTDRIPYVGFSNETLSQLPRVQAGDTLVCPKCDQKHTLESTDDGSTLLLFYTCKGKSYMGALDGRLTAGRKPDISGETEL